MKSKTCPFCGKVNGIDHRFCVYCGKELPVVEIDSTNHEGQKNLKNEDFINCPECNAINYCESVECSECGYLFDEDIKRTFRTSTKREYKRCPRCANLLPQDAGNCGICGFELISIDYDYPDEFFDNPLYKEYGKNRGFFKTINIFHDYDDFLLNFKDYCDENGIYMGFSKRGMVQCPQCQHLFSFISPYFIRNHKCPHCHHEFDFESGGRYCPNCGKAMGVGQKYCECGYELDFVLTDKSYCLNCGRPVRDGQFKCECGYELTDIRCPECFSSNPYTNSYCTSCGSPLQSSEVVFPDTLPKGCIYEDNKIVFEFDFIKRQVSKNPYDENGMVYTQTLRRENSKCERIIDEISARWWITSPFNCIACKAHIDPFKDVCSKCNSTHYTLPFENRIRELKTSQNNYVEPHSIDELSRLKWSYKLKESNLKDYLNSLAPSIGESQINYRQRLFKEFWENSAIIYIIKNIWAIYFKNRCMGCLTELKDNQMTCPSCGMKKFVSPLGEIFNDEKVESDRVPHEHEWDAEGITYDEWMDMYGYRH